MSKCSDLSIEFYSTNKDVIETLRLKLVEFFEYDGGDNREWCNIIMDNIIPFDYENKKFIYTDAGYDELMSGVETDLEVMDVSEHKGYYTIHCGESGITDNRFWVAVASKYKVDLDITGVSCEPEWDADQTSYVDGVCNYAFVELADEEIIKRIRNEHSDWEVDYDDVNRVISSMTDAQIDDIKDNEFRGEINGWLRDELDKQETDNTAPVVQIDCENKYLDNLKRFVQNNLSIPNLDEHLIKSGLFTTTIGTEKRKRIEVDVNGVKLYADSKHGKTQRKLNVSKLEKLLIK